MSCCVGLAVSHSAQVSYSAIPLWPLPMKMPPPGRRQLAKNMVLWVGCGFHLGLTHPLPGCSVQCADCTPVYRSSVSLLPALKPGLRPLPHLTPLPSHALLNHPLWPWLWLTPLVVACHLPDSDYLHASPEAPYTANHAQPSQGPSRGLSKVETRGKWVSASTQGCEKAQASTLYPFQGLQLSLNLAWMFWNINKWCFVKARNKQE